MRLRWRRGGDPEPWLCRSQNGCVLRRGPSAGGTVGRQNRNKTGGIGAFHPRIPRPFSQQLRIVPPGQRRCLSKIAFHRPCRAGKMLRYGRIQLFCDQQQICPVFHHQLHSILRIAKSGIVRRDPQPVQYLFNVFLHISHPIISDISSSRARSRCFRSGGSRASVFV